MASKRKSRQSQTAGEPGPNQVERELNDEETAEQAANLAEITEKINKLEVKKADATSKWNAELRELRDEQARLADIVKNRRVFVDATVQHEGLN